MEKNVGAQRKVIVYIACSLDGFIAKPNDNLDFLSLVERDGEDYGYSDFMATVGTVIQGRRTYDWIMNAVPQYPHADKEVYILTRTGRPSLGNIHFYTQAVDLLIERLKSEAVASDNSDNSIFVDGGAQIVNLLLNLQLVDELIVSVIPILVGSGTRLFETGIPEQGLRLETCKSYDSGLVQMHYSFL